MRNFKFLPSETEIKEFQNDWFLKDHIAAILPMNRRFPIPREKSPSVREVPFSVSTRVVKAFKKSVHSITTLRIQLLKPCIDNISFVTMNACVGDNTFLLLKCVRNIRGDPFLLPNAIPVSLKQKGKFLLNAFQFTIWRRNISCATRALRDSECDIAVFSFAHIQNMS